MTKGKDSLDRFANYARHGFFVLFAAACVLASFTYYVLLRLPILVILDLAGWLFSLLGISIEED